MPVQKALDDLAVKEFPVFREALPQGIDEHASQWAAQPFMGGNVKPRLLPLQDGSGQFVLPQFFQYEFLFGATDFQPRGQLGGKFHNSVIEKRGANFDGVCHAHAVALHQNIVRQIIVLVEPEQRCELVFRLRQSIHLRQKPME